MQMALTDTMVENPDAKDGDTRSLEDLAKDLAKLSAEDLNNVLKMVSTKTASAAFASDSRPKGIVDRLAGRIRVDNFGISIPPKRSK